jgi:hypothetical protein
MFLTFTEEGHSYESIPAVSWTSVTKLIESYCNPFDEEDQALRSSQNMNSKWFGMDPVEIIKLWKAENLRSTDAGTWVHNKWEKNVSSLKHKEWEGKKLKVFPGKWEGETKIAPAQELEEGVYPEHIIYNENLQVCGQADIVNVRDGFVDVIDYKTSKEIEDHSYGFKYGNASMMLEPVNHLEDCNLSHYVLQLGIYMRLILLKNPALKPGKLILIHVKMDINELDQYGFPILKRTKENGYKIKRTKNYNIKYIENEVRSVLKDHYLKL